MSKKIVEIKKTNNYKFFIIHELIMLLVYITKYRIGSNFWKFYLIRTRFTLGESVSLVKVFWLFTLEWIFLGVQSVNTVGRCTTSYLLAWPMCL